MRRQQQATPEKTDLRLLPPPPTRFKLFPENSSVFVDEEFIYFSLFAGNRYSLIQLLHFERKETKSKNGKSSFPPNIA
jgi:hypothetical protein